MKQANFIFSGYNKKDELIESFIIEDRTEHEANNEAMHYVEAHQSINDWSLTPTPVKETEQFFNGDLQTDAEKHLRADNIEIKKDEAENDGELMYYLDVNDDSYFYHNESDRDFDYARAKRLFTKKPAPTPTSKEGLEDGGFTKGDWKIVPISDCCLTVQVDGFREDKKGGYIAEIKWERAAGGIGKEDEANARLIAAAPAMFEALKKAHSQLHDMCDMYCRDKEGYLKHKPGGWDADLDIEIQAILTRINKD